MRTLAWFACLITTVVVPTALPGEANEDAEATLTTLTNMTRSERQLKGLIRAEDLDAVARRYAAELAREGGDPRHNPTLSDEVDGDWYQLGEIVGRVSAGGRWEEHVHDAFLRSPSHEREITRFAYTDVGVGVAYSPTAKRYYVTEVFRAALRPTVRPPSVSDAFRR